jgi:hypothetical protein
MMDDWSPDAVGDLFMLVMPNGSKMLMRVTDIDDATHWNATQASIDDALTAATNLPVFDYRPFDG